MELCRNLTRFTYAAQSMLFKRAIHSGPNGHIVPLIQGCYAVVIRECGAFQLEARHFSCGITLKDTNYVQSLYTDTAFLHYGGITIQNGAVPTRAQTIRVLFR
ncbi:hypothetical protein Pelo_18926 [Pelomyxa schiedti]|nr:hypothetical protein Pelo_18926 [Pelomyxa schiedti]